MELKGETTIAAPRESVWAALNDPDVLARCIDGVETLTRSGDNRFDGKMNAKVGPVRATFTGTVSLENIDPPNGYTLVGEGKGGVAGFAKGAAEVALSDAPAGGTLLVYHAKSTVGGKLAQLGARLIEGTAKSYAESFFGKLKAELEGAATGGDAPQGASDAVNLGIGSDTGESVAASAAASESPAVGPAEREGGLSPLAWGLLIAALSGALVLVLLMW